MCKVQTVRRKGLGKKEALSQLVECVMLQFLNLRSQSDNSELEIQEPILAKIILNKVTRIQVDSHNIC